MESKTRPQKEQRNQDAFHMVIVFLILLIGIQATVDDFHCHQDLLGLQDAGGWNTQKSSGPNGLKGIEKTKPLYSILRINDEQLKIEENLTPCPPLLSHLKVRSLWLVNLKLTNLL